MGTTAASNNIFLAPEKIIQERSHHETEPSVCRLWPSGRAELRQGWCEEVERARHMGPLSYDKPALNLFPALPLLQLPGQILLS